MSTEQGSRDYDMGTNLIPDNPWISAEAIPGCPQVQVEKMVASLPPAAAGSSTISSCPYYGNGSNGL